MLCGAVVKELTINHRQSGGVTWSDRLNMTHHSLGGQQEGEIHALLKTKLGNRSGGAISESALKDKYHERGHGYKWTKLTSLACILTLSDM